MMGKDEVIMALYAALWEHFGPRGWWPGENRFEIIVGAILTQAVAWRNAEKALQGLKEAQLFSATQIIAAEVEELALALKPALYNRQKAKKLAGLMTLIQSEYKGDYDLMFSEPQEILRRKLLALWGIGEETADSILLYAGQYPVFVVDSYTRRIFSRIGLVEENIDYTEMQTFMQDNIAQDVGLYNEYHALLVALGSQYCKKTRPACSGCPIAYYCKKIL
jgi:endonuclease III related protein